jgi:hypothetical protein
MERRWYVLQDQHGSVEILPFEKFHPGMGSVLPEPSKRLEWQELEGEWEVVRAVDPQYYFYLEAVSAHDAFYGKPKGMNFLCRMVGLGIDGGLMKARRNTAKAQASDTGP